MPTAEGDCMFLEGAQKTHKGEHVRDTLNRRFSRLAALGVFISVVVLSACGADAESTQPANAPPTTRDSSGVEIVEWATLPRVELPEWRFDTVAVVAVGLADGPAPYLLGNVIGASRLSDGRIVIADGQSREVRLFDSTGLHLKSAGGVGDGPGEFRSLGTISVVDSTRVSAFDPTLSRVTVMDLDAGLRTWQVSTSEFCGAGDDVSARRERSCEVDGILPDGTLIVKGTPRSQRRLTNGEITEMRGVRQDLILVRNLRPTRIDSLLSWSSVRWVGKSQGLNVPFWASEALYSPRGHAAYGAALIVVAGSSSIFELRVYSDDGQLRRIIRSQQRPERVTRDMVAMQTEAALAVENGSEQANDYLERFKPGGTVPHFGEVLVDRAARIWIADYRAPVNLGGTLRGQWTVLSPDGQPLGRVGELAREDILELGADYGLFRKQNDLGVETVIMKRLVASSTTNVASTSVDDSALVVGVPGTDAIGDRE